jgi:hypothetical protein
MVSHSVYLINLVFTVVHFLPPAFMKTQKYQGYRKAQDMNRKGYRKDYVMVIGSEQTQHAVEGLDVDYDLREGDFLAGGKFVLDAGNEGDEAEHDGGY